MKKILFVLTLFVTGFSYALHVECVGNAVQLVNEGDTLLLFESKPELKTLSSVGEVDWYRLSDTINPVQSGTDYFYPEHGEGYAIKVQDRWEYFWVFDYQKLRPTVSQIEAYPSCENTKLILQGEVSPMSYKRINQQSRTYPRTCEVQHINAAWETATEMWVDTIITDTLTFTNELTVAASPVNTQYIITDELAKKLQLSEDSLCSPEVTPVALKAHPTTITTTRGDDGLSNEVARPTEKTDIENMSAPLEVYFQANGINATYYKWNIYHANKQILTRHDAEHRYTFMDYGAYRAVLWVSNDMCQLDSVEFTITIQQSMLNVPNTFTPNGDGVNDEFRVVYRSIKEFHCWIYNRWGHLVYEWTDPAKGWDGTIGGRPAPIGAYYYVIRALGTDAATDANYFSKSSYQKKKEKNDESILGVFQYSGDINLIR